jgi:phosphonate transport system ATP-binding protein
MIFQSFNLVDSYTVLQNTLMGKLSYVKTLNSVLGIYSKKEVDECMAILKRIGLEQLAHERAADLSGGEKQRVGIARALAQNPKIILADEPVSSLDPKLMRDIMDILQKICVEDGITLIVSLHFLELARKYATRIIGLKEGEIVFDNKPSELTEESIVNIYGKTDSWFMYGKVDY